MYRSWHLGIFAEAVLLLASVAISAQNSSGSAMAASERLPEELHFDTGRSDAASHATNPGSDKSLSLNNLGVTLAKEGRYEQAAAILVQAADLTPDLYQAHRNLSIVYGHLKRPEDSLAEARLAVRAAPTEPNALDQWCEAALAYSEDTSEAARCFERLKTVQTLDPSSAGQYGIALYKAERYDEAIKVLEEACARLPLNAELVNALGLAYFEKKAYKPAAERFKNAVELDPDRDSFRFNLGLAYLGNKNRAGALSQYRLLEGGGSKFARKLYRVLYRHLVVSVEELAGRR